LTRLTYLTSSDLTDTKLDPDYLPYIIGLDWHQTLPGLLTLHHHWIGLHHRTGLTYRTLPYIMIGLDFHHQTGLTFLTLPSIIIRSDNLPYIIIRSDNLPYIIIRSDTLPYIIISPDLKLTRLAYLPYGLDSDRSFIIRPDLLTLHHNF
jgi:hypothetical protein